MKTVVKNNTCAVHGLPIARGHEWGNYNLMPGVNEVPAEVWAELAKHPQVAQRLEDGTYEVVFETLADNASAITKVKNEREAVKLVAETVIDPILEKWAETEKRPKVRAAIKTQMAKLELTPEEMASSKGKV